MSSQVKSASSLLSVANDCVTFSSYTHIELTSDLLTSFMTSQFQQYSCCDKFVSIYAMQVLQLFVYVQDGVPFEQENDSLIHMSSPRALLEIAS